MKRILMKGNEAIAEAAIQCGCKMYFGYPITPQNEIPEYFAANLPKVGGVFLQAESEVAASNMLFGAASTATRAMVSSAGPGISLMQETISYMVGSRLPCVIINMARGGPGLGNLSATQADYFQSTRGGGHGDYSMFTLAPASVQEACDCVQLAFDIAEKYRQPVMVLGDAIIGQMMEPVAIKHVTPKPYDISWAARGWDGKSRKKAEIGSLFHEPVMLAGMVSTLLDTYEKMKREDVMFEEYNIEGAQYVIVAFGTVSRIVDSAIDILANKGLKVGMLRPITLFPFPDKAIARIAEMPSVKKMIVAEMNAGQMVYDVELAVKGRKEVLSLAKYGTLMPTPKEIAEFVLAQVETR
jgi:2-oxoglutarate ferredoxin oxidoreductase subunit alpha